MFGVLFSTIVPPPQKNKTKTLLSFQTKKKTQGGPQAKDTQSKNVDALNGVFVEMHIEGSIAAQDGLGFATRRLQEKTCKRMCGECHPEKAVRTRTRTHTNAHKHTNFASGFFCCSMDVHEKKTFLDLNPFKLIERPKQMSTLSSRGVKLWPAAQIWPARQSLIAKIFGL